jgi:hypothetical protein
MKKQSQYFHGSEASAFFLPESLSACRINAPEPEKGNNVILSSISIPIIFFRAYRRLSIPVKVEYNKQQTLIGRATAYACQWHSGFKSYGSVKEIS